MTDSPHQFKLEIDTSLCNPKFVVSDMTDPDAVATYTQPLPKGGPPYTLMLWRAPDAPNALTIVPADELIDQLLTKWDETVGSALRAVASERAAQTAATGDASTISAASPTPTETDESGVANPAAARQQAATPTVGAQQARSPASDASTTSGPQYWFELTLDTNSTRPTLTVKDVSNPDSVSLSQVDLPSSEPPFVLQLVRSAQRSDSLTIKPQPPIFNASVTSGRSVLQFSASISDRRLTTRDETRYTVRLKNVSEYYIAEDIWVRLDLVPIPRLSDGNETLVIIPTEQHLRCIDPGEQHDVVFSVVTRGVRPGAYPLRVQLTYRIVYWDGRQTSTTYSQMLSVQQ